MDISRIENKFLRENQLVGLGFPTQGYIFQRCTGVETLRYEYDESPGTIAAATFEDSTRLPMSAYSLDNVLRVENCNHLYQMFMGWKPGVVRQYLYYPFETARRNLDTKRIYDKSPFGFIDGFESEYDKPSPETELFIPKDVEVGFGWYNPSNKSVTVELNMIIRRMEMEIIRDVDLIEKIMLGKQPCRLTTLGGIGGSVNYHAKSVLDVDFIKLGSPRDVIEEAVS